MNKNKRILLAKLIGYIDSDGFFTNRGNGKFSVGFSNNNIFLIKDFSDTFEKIFSVKPHIYCNVRNNKKNYTCNKQDEEIIKIIKSFDINSLNKKEKCAYLQGIYDGDGSISLSQREIGVDFHLRFHNKDIEIIKRVQKFLQDIGIKKSNIYSEKIRGWGDGIVYNVSITNQKDARIFYENIKLKSEHKINSLEEYLDVVKPYSSDVYPIELKKKAIKLHKQGLGCRKIAKKLNVSSGRICKWYKQFDDNIRYKGYPARWDKKKKKKKK